MVMTILNEQSRPAARPTDRLDALRAAWLDVRRRHAERRALARVGRLGPRLLADMGFPPEDTTATFAGRWDDLRPNGLLVHRRY